MSEILYKAFISYSHQDENWAKWLQRGLESYRIPKHLHGEGIPDRLFPIFRDREEMSSSANLTETVREALRSSESMIVICSKASANSQWVNDEIRIFRSLKGEDRIFTMVVDGDPSTGDPDNTCFPQALLEHENVELHEPLAADPREWADGKTLAKLKLVAGILGIRLDELRQRDLKRRRRRQAIGLLALVATIVLGLITTSSMISEQRQRENAENMANFVVELGESLKNEVDLETLEKMSSTAMRYLQDLNPEKLNPETSIKVGLVLRQLGNVNLGQGKFSESLIAFRQSLDLFQQLSAKQPERLDILYELAQAEFYVGAVYLEQGNMEKAWVQSEHYLNISKDLYHAEPNNRTWLLEVSYGTSNLLTLHVISGQTANQEILNDADEAVALARKTLQSWPDNSEVIDHYSNTLAWAANAELLACNLQPAIDYRRETLDLALSAVNINPSNNDLRHSLALSHLGIAITASKMGELPEAERHCRSALEIHTELAVKDPSNALLTQAIVREKIFLARLLMHTQKLEVALILMEEIQKSYESLPPASELGKQLSENYWRFSKNFADLLIRTGDHTRAQQILTRVSERIVQSISEGANNHNLSSQAAELRYLWFELNQYDLATELPVLLSVELESEGEFHKCYTVDLSAKLAIVEGDRTAAGKYVDWLQAKNYREPGFIRFCKRHDLCDD